MKLLLLTAGGRSGSDFFQSLTDDHPQILQFPGVLVADNLEKIINNKSSKTIAINFIKNYSSFFDSRKGKFERWHKLGKNKNSFFKVNENKFISHFQKINKNEKNRLKILKNLHFAYELAKGKSIKGKKILFLHTHLLSWSKQFINFFSLRQFEIIHTIRHPLSSISIPLKDWFKYKNGSGFFYKDLYFVLDRVCNIINDLNKLSKVHIVQLEILHTKNIKMMKSFCRKFKIKFTNSLTKSSKNGLQWWGDSVGKVWLPGVNKKFKTVIDINYLSERDFIFLQNLTSHIIKKYKYEFFFPEESKYFLFSPMKCEKKIFKNTFKYLFYLGFRWKHLVTLPLYYILRIIMLNKIVINTREKDLPKSLI